MDKKRVLIVCTGNVARSQMAEGFLRHDAGDRFEVFSAGLNPSYVRPGVIQVMREVGIDISHHRSKWMSRNYWATRKPWRERRYLDPRHHWRDIDSRYQPNPCCPFLSMGTNAQDQNIQILIVNQFAPEEQ